MAPSRPPKVIKVKVPRHNAQRIGTKLGAEIRNLSRMQKLRTDIYQPSQEAVESASEWNSLLITARAERGPQWDVGTQQFHVDQYSVLYYDPTPLIEAIKKHSEEDNTEEQQQQPQHHPYLPQQIHQSNSRHHTPRSERDFHISNTHHQVGPPGHDPSMQHRHHPGPVNYPYPTTPNMNMNMNMGGPAPISRPYTGGPPGAPFNTVAPNQFYGNENPSPMRMGPMGGMGMIDHGPGMGGHPMGGIPPGMGVGMGGGGMPAMSMNISPDVGRRVTRGMGEEFPLY